MRSDFDERLSDRSKTERPNTYSIGLWNSSERFLSMRDNLLKLFHQIFDKDYLRLIQRLKETILKQVEAAEERIKEILDMEYRLFTLSNEYMTMVDKITREITDDGSIEEGKMPSNTTTAVPKTFSYNALTNIVSSTMPNLISVSSSSSVLNDTSAPGSNEARAALAIQIALNSYCQVRPSNLYDFCYSR
jgi:predicted metal-binding transcription factor (methanogenesis marker protein 9)